MVNQDVNSFGEFVFPMVIDVILLMENWDEQSIHGGGWRLMDCIDGCGPSLTIKHPRHGYFPTKTNLFMWAVFIRGLRYWAKAKWLFFMVHGISGIW